MLIWSHPPCGKPYIWQRQIEVHDSDGNQIKRGYRGVSGNLRLLVFDFDTAATSLCHFAALAVHHLAAGIFRLRHLLFSHTCHHRRCCNQQEEDGNQTGSAPEHD